MTGLALAWHLHQPTFVPDEEVRDWVKRSYAPLLEAHAERGIPLALNVTGALLERLAEVAPSFLDRIAALVDEGLVEPLGSGHHHPSFPLLSVVDAREHVRRDREATERYLGEAPSGFWPTDLAWVHLLVPVLADAGYDWSVVDGAALVQGNALPQWDETERNGLTAFRPDTSSLTVDTEFHRPYAATFGDQSLGIFVRDSLRSNALVGPSSVLRDAERVDEYASDLRSRAKRGSVLVGADAERITTGTLRGYRRLLDQLVEADTTVGTPEAVYDDRLAETRFFPASTFQYDLEPWMVTDDDWAYHQLLDEASRRVDDLRLDGGSADARRRAESLLLEAQDSGRLFWHYLRRTREPSYKCAYEALRVAREALR